MPNFFLIQDQELRDLLMTSPTVSAFDEEYQGEMIEKLASAPPDVVAGIKSTLTQERHKLEASDATEEQKILGDIKDLESALKEIDTMKKEYDSSVRKFGESKSIAEDNQTAEKLLEQLNTL